MSEPGTAPTPASASNRSSFGLETRETVVFLLYVAMVAVAGLYYQQSQDEGREWIIARSFAIPHLIFHVLHYEGHPPLLYLLLWLPAHLHMPYVWISWLSAVVGATSIYLLLRLSPFPFYVRAVLPFCFALGYQDVVVARSYVLFPLLGFLAAHLYRSWPCRPLAFAITLALLANVSFHGTLVATGFAIAYAVRLMRESKIERPSLVKSLPRPRVLWSACAIFLASLVLVSLCIYPAKYIGMPPGQAISRILHRMAAPAATPASPTAPSSLPRSHLAPLQGTEAGSLHPHGETFWLVCIYPFSNISPLSCAFEVLFLVYLCVRRQWELVLPIVLLDYFLLFGFVAYRHTPLVWISVLLVLWAAWDVAPRPASHTLQQMVAFAIALLCVLQIRWTLGALRYELHHATYPAKATAEYLKTLPNGTTIDGDKTAYAILPYQANYIPKDRANGRFADHASYATSVTIDDLQRDPSQILLLNELLDAPDATLKLHASSYTEIHTFCGGPYFPNIPPGISCFHIFAKR